jgi:hypothetical protein
MSGSIDKGKDKDKDKTNNEYSDGEKRIKLDILTAWQLLDSEKTQSLMDTTTTR